MLSRSIKNTGYTYAENLLTEHTHTCSTIGIITNIPSTSAKIYERATYLVLPEIIPRNAISSGWVLLVRVDSPCDLKLLSHDETFPTDQEHPTGHFFELA